MNWQNITSIVLRTFGKAIVYVEKALEQVSPSRRKEIELLLRRKQRLEGKRLGSESLMIDFSLEEKGIQA